MKKCPLQINVKAYREPCLTSVMELSAKIVSGFHGYFLQNSSVTGALQGSEYASVMQFVFMVMIVKKFVVFSETRFLNVS